LGDEFGYTLGIGGCEDGEGKGTKGYGVVGMTDGPGCVSTLMLVVVVVRDAEEEVLGEEEGEDEGEGEVVLLPDWDELGCEVDKKGECVEGVAGGKWEDGDDNAPGCFACEDEGEAAKARPVARRTSKTKDRMGRSAVRSRMERASGAGKVGRKEKGWRNGELYKPTDGAEKFTVLKGETASIEGLEATARDERTSTKHMAALVISQLEPIWKSNLRVCGALDHHHHT
jgi:hypothetical protein